MSLERVKVLLFDTFGTVADWRGSIARKGRNWLGRNLSPIQIGMRLRGLGALATNPGWHRYSLASGRGRLSM